jgi:hypothetical protein
LHISHHPSSLYYAHNDSLALPFGIKERSRGDTDSRFLPFLCSPTFAPFLVLPSSFMFRSSFGPHSIHVSPVATPLPPSLSSLSLAASFRQPRRHFRLHSAAFTMLSYLSLLAGATRSTLLTSKPGAFSLLFVAVSSGDARPLSPWRPGLATTMSSDS